MLSVNVNDSRIAPADNVAEIAELQNYTFRAGKL